MSGAGAPPPQGPNPVEVIKALRAMSHLMAQGAEGARKGEHEADERAERQRSTKQRAAGMDPDLGAEFLYDQEFQAIKREAVTLGLLAGSLEAVSGLASMMALLLVEIEALRHSQDAILQRLGPRIIIPGEGHG